jgi:hypothetical protein
VRHRNIGILCVVLAIGAAIAAVTWQRAQQDDQVPDTLQLSKDIECTQF